VSDDIAIRSLSTQAEYAACVELQRDTWGRAFTDAVPASILHVAQEIGGVAAGAFDSSGELVGFVFGMTGIRDGHIVHWSDMLAVRPELRSSGIGRRLKEFQRHAVALLGAEEILWTYDPLVARNAHLNFNVFGVRVVDYVVNMYGEDTGSDLHRGLGTDRFIVAWPVRDDALEARRAITSRAHSDSAYRSAGVIGEPSAGPPDWTTLTRDDRLRVAVPGDIHAIQTSDPVAASAWRVSTREAFQGAYACGYRVHGFAVTPGDSRGYYLLSRPT
jgi:predicted GNAT superfamily acetyltransferase